MHLLAYLKGELFCLIKPYFKMKESVYSVRVSGPALDVDTPFIYQAELYRAQTIDEACAVALGYFRNSNCSGVSFSVYQGDKEIVVFKHE